MEKILQEGLRRIMAVDVLIETTESDSPLLTSLKKMRDEYISTYKNNKIKFIADSLDYVNYEYSRLEKTNPDYDLIKENLVNAIKNIMDYCGDTNVSTHEYVDNKCIHCKHELTYIFEDKKLVRKDKLFKDFLISLN